MKHKIGYNRLGRKTAHRKAMTRNMLTSLFRHERIKTTKAKALAVRRVAEKMITRAGVDSVHNRRMIGRDIKDKAVLAKVFTDIGPRFKERPGGYTRVLKLGPRPSDAAEMVILELVVDDQVKESPRKAKKKADPEKKDAPRKTVKAAAKTDEVAAKAEAPAAVVEENSAPAAVEVSESDADAAAPAESESEPKED